MPNVGDLEEKFGRRYMFVNVNPALGPGTWRLSMPEDYPGSGGGGGGTANLDFDGVDPIVVDTTPGVGSNPTIVKTSMDIGKLDSRV